MTGKKPETQVIAKPAETSITIRREFDAPRELVFRAYEDPKLYARWYGCETMKITAEKFECRTGGSYRLAQSIKGMGEFVVRGVFHEVREAEFIVKTIESDRSPGRVVLESTRFEVLPGNRARVVGSIYLQSVADRDEWIRLGVEKGTREGHDRLWKLLKELMPS